MQFIGESIFVRIFCVLLIMKFLYSLVLLFGLSVKAEELRTFANDEYFDNYDLVYGAIIGRYMY